MLLIIIEIDKFSLHFLLDLLKPLDFNTLELVSCF